MTATTRAERIVGASSVGKTTGTANLNTPSPLRGFGGASTPWPVRRFGGAGTVSRVATSADASRIVDLSRLSGVARADLSRRSDVAAEADIMPCSFEPRGSTRLVQTAARGEKSRKYLCPAALFHTDFHSFCEELVTSWKGRDLKGPSGGSMRSANERQRVSALGERAPRRKLGAS
jgi:hypothetical protein